MLQSPSLIYMKEQVDLQQTAQADPTIDPSAESNATEQINVGQVDGECYSANGNPSASTQAYTQVKLLP